jgi:hypothetical protein
MQYMLLIYVDEVLESERSEEAFNQIFQEYEVFDEQAKAKKAVLSAAALQPSSMATTVRVREGKTLITDGPFAEAKEQMGGFYMMECANLDEAIEWASKIPDAKYGTIEIRPKMVFH